MNPDQLFIVALAGILVTATLGIITAVLSYRASTQAAKANVQAETSVRKVEALEVHVDGRLTLLLAKTEEAARAAGLAAGIAQGVETARQLRTDEKLLSLTRAEGKVEGLEQANPPTPVVVANEEPVQVEIVEPKKEEKP